LEEITGLICFKSINRETSKGCHFYEADHLSMKIDDDRNIERQKRYIIVLKKFWRFSADGP